MRGERGARNIRCRRTPRKRGIQYAAASRFDRKCFAILDRPLSRAMTAEFVRWFEGVGFYAAGTGSAVTDLIFSIAKREVTFLSATALISFL